MRNKRILCAILAAMLLAGFALTSCGNERGTETTPGGANTDTETETETETETKATMATTAAQYTGRDYGGYAVRIADRDAQGDWDTFDVYAEEITGEVINDAVYSRNTKMEELLNIKIEERSFADPTGSTKTSITAGSDDFDMITDGLNSLSTLSTGGLLLDYNTISTIHPENEWWDQAMYRDLSVLNHVYFMTGDISVMDNYGTWCYLFNKDMVSDLGLENPYTLVNEGKWTIDKFRELSADVSTDLNGDGVMDQADQYGLSTTPDTVYGLFYSCGGRFIEKDADDLPVFSVDVDKCSSILEKTGSIMADRNATLLSSLIKGETNPIVTIQNCFIEGRSLFYGEVMFHVNRLREMADDFGIIPMPKYDEAQAQYVTYTNPAGLMLVIPKTTADVGCTGAVLEAMASLSHTTLTPAYYDNALKGKFARDNDSGAMLDLIFENRVYDLTQIYGWGSMPSSYNALALKGSSDLASLIAQKQSAIDTSIEKFVAAFTEE